MKLKLSLYYYTFILIICSFYSSYGQNNNEINNQEITIENQISSDNNKENNNENREITQEQEDGNVNLEIKEKYIPKEFDFLFPIDQKEHPVFTTKNKKISRIKEKLRFRNAGKEFAFIFSLLSLFIFSIYYYKNPIVFSHLLEAFKNPNVTNRQLKEMIQQDKLNNFILNGIAVLSISLFLFQVLQIKGNFIFFNFSFLYLFTLVLISVLFLIIFQYIIQKLIAYLFRIPKVIDDTLFQFFLTIKVLGLILIPISLALYFMDSFFEQILISISFFIIAVSLIIRFLRTKPLFQYFFRSSKLQLILYLCGSEIIPVLVFLKILQVF